MFNQSQPCELSIVSRKYLKEFDCILQNMSEKMLTCFNFESITILFINQIIPHHEAAIKMSENLLRYTTNIGLQNIALEIIKTQKIQIEKMKEIEACSGCKDNEICEIQKYMHSYNIITKTMISKMGESARTNNINFNFVCEMIPHHKGAIALCENALRFPIDCRLKKIIKNIIIDQVRGIKQLNCIRKNIMR